MLRANLATGVAHGPASRCGRHLSSIARCPLLAPVLGLRSMMPARMASLRGFGGRGRGPPMQFDTGRRVGVDSEGGASDLGQPAPTRPGESRRFRRPARSKSVMPLERSLLQARFALSTASPVSCVELGDRAGRCPRPIICAHHVHRWIWLRAICRGGVVAAVTHDNDAVGQLLDFIQSVRYEEERLTRRRASRVRH